MENDPLFNCKKYSHYGDYDSCLEKNYIRRTKVFLNCTPPWMTDAEDNWCCENLMFAKELKDEIDVMLDNIINNQVDGGTKESCPSPCRQTM